MICDTGMCEYCGNFNSWHKGRCDEEKAYIGSLKAITASRTNLILDVLERELVKLKMRVTVLEAERDQDKQ